MLGMMQVSRRIPFDDPNVLNGCRAAYLFSNLLIALIYAYILSKINAKKGTLNSTSVQTLRQCFLLWTAISICFAFLEGQWQMKACKATNRRYNPKQT